MVKDRRTGDDRREETRFSVKIDVDWEGISARGAGTVSDISVLGCFVMCSGEVEDGETVKIFFPLSGGMKLRFWGEVVNHFLEIGFAVRFVELTTAQKDFLDRFIGTLGDRTPERAEDGA